MIALQYEIQTRTLHNLIDKLAKSYDDQQKTWAKSSSELNEVARILKNGGWSCGNVEQLITAIQLRLIYNKPQTNMSLAPIPSPSAQHPTSSIALSVASSLPLSPLN